MAVHVTRQTERTDLAVVKNEMKHFATKADIMKWTVGVGFTAVLAITSIIMHIDNRLTQDIREVRQEAREMHKELKQMIVNLSKKVDEQNLKEGKRAHENTR